MKTETFHLELITPCFCAGADQAAAEFRAPSIRGKLRWWFRVLGGSFDDEAWVFGSVAGESGRGSAITVRVLPLPDKRLWEPINFGPASNTGYLLYFAKASAKGARWNPKGALPEGARFSIQVVWRREIPPACGEVFDLALDCFLMLGSLGLRSTRGLGCFHCPERPFSEDAFNKLLERIKKRAPGFRAYLGVETSRGPQLFEPLGAQLRALRNGYSAGTPSHSNPTPLGSSKPRQASAVYLRPVLLNYAKKCRIVVFEAPAEKVLAPESRKRAPRLAKGLPPAMAAPNWHRKR